MQEYVHDGRPDIRELHPEEIEDEHQSDDFHHHPLVEEPGEAP